MPRPILPRYNSDHFGFFQVGPFKIYSKLEAIEISVKTGHSITWNFNKEVFSNFNWKQEPIGSLKFWYAERAKQLREHYDYIVLMYSGGADSWNMLKSFVDNGIFVDEIAHFIYKEGTSKTVENDLDLAESVLTAFPTANYLINSNPIYKNTKQRLIEGGPHIIEKFKNINKETHFYHSGNTMFSPWSTAIGDWRDIEKDYKDLADRKNKICFLWGYDKPYLIDKGSNKFSLTFSEMGLSCMVTPKQQMDSFNEEWHADENFYWTPDMPEVCCKQAHVLKNYIEKIDDSMVDNYYLKYHNPLDTWSPTYRIIFTKQNKQYELTQHGGHKLIYEGWNDQTIVCEKSPSPVFSSKDYWWFKNNVPESNVSWYVKSIFDLRKYVKSLDPSWWVEKRHDPQAPIYRGGLKACTNSYDLN